jgi:hypothetical protein
MTGAEAYKHFSYLTYGNRAGSLYHRVDKIPPTDQLLTQWQRFMHVTRSAHLILHWIKQPVPCNCASPLTSHVTLTSDTLNLLLFPQTGSSVGIVTRLQAGWGRSIPGRSRDFSLRHRVETDAGDHTAPCTTGTGSSLSGGTPAEAWSRPFTSIECQG